MKLEEKHLLEQHAIALEAAADSAKRRTWGILNAGWSLNTAGALKRAAKIVRKALEGS